MIPPNLGDLSAAARAMMCVPPPARRLLMCRMIDQARTCGHPAGRTLMSAALRHPIAAEPALEDMNYLRCLKIGIEVLIDFYAA